MARFMLKMFQSALAYKIRMLYAVFDEQFFGDLIPVYLLCPSTHGD